MSQDAHHDSDPDWPLVQAVQREIAKRVEESSEENAEKKAPPPPVDPVVEDAFRRLVERYERRVLRFFLNKGYGIDDAKQLTQESFLRVFQGMGRLKSSFWGFLVMTARNVYRNDVRRRRTQSREGTEISTDDVEGSDQRYLVLGGDQLDRLVEQGEEERIRAVIATMPPRRRQCADLRLQGLKLQEIAETLKISEGSVKMHLFKARKTLETALDLGSQPKR